MSHHSTTAFVSSHRVVWKSALSHRVIVFALLAAVIVVDQLTKWWAWRHAPLAQINFGGNALVGDTVGRWYADPMTGGLLDLLDFVFLSITVAVLLRRRRPVMVLITGALMIGGWVSNLTDRLGMHYLTAPGSVRGAVDFIPLGRIYYNLADVFIVVGTLLFLLTVSVVAAKQSAATRSWAPTTNSPRRARSWLSAAAGALCVVAVVVGFGAVNYGGITAPSTSDWSVTRSPA